VAVWVAAAALCGCDSAAPRAPALRDDPVFQSDREGIRFLAPEGWRQNIRGEPPPGPTEKERPLVEYARMSGGAGASLRVSLRDVPPSENLAEYLAGPSFSVKRWAQTGPEEEAAVGSATGTRYVFRGKAGNVELTKEVVAVRRGERVYFFTALYAPKDTEVREQLRRVVGSVIWKK
jgi:hypothetical protein